MILLQVGLWILAALITLSVVIATTRSGKTTSERVSALAVGAVVLTIIISAALVIGGLA